jgi:AcrR family transcriptional regulator
MIRHLVGSKEALWDAAADYLFARMRAALSQALTDVDPTDPVQRAEAQVRASVRTAAQVPSLAGFVMQAGLAGGERYDQLVARYLRPFYEFTLAPFRQLAAEGRVVDVPLHFIFLVATNAAVNPFAQAANSRALAGIDLTDPAVADAYADALVTILKAGLLRGGIGP